MLSKLLLLLSTCDPVHTPLLQVGIELKFKDAGYRHMAAVTHVPELAQVRALWLLRFWLGLPKQSSRGMATEPAGKG